MVFLKLFLWYTTQHWFISLKITYRNNYQRCSIKKYFCEFVVKSSKKNKMFIFSKVAGSGAISAKADLSSICLANCEAFFSYSFLHIMKHFLKLWFPLFVVWKWMWKNVWCLVSMCLTNYDKSFFLRVYVISQTWIVYRVF